ncbi:MAG TPA: transposase zinc-binding domain-containing protein, partial [Flavobacteriaceae bacterium]|nr:transposase zinc-binding domain-containing protein [Flavobacteriaceae bacterium]
MQNQISISNILSEYGERYISQNHIKGQEKGIIRLLASCRSHALGSHYEKCNQCSYLGKAYNSCRNRHCPVCQQKDKEQWLAKRMEELLPIGYYHLVFTIPAQLNQLCLQNKKLMYDILFKAASETVLELARDTKHLGAETGLITVLHTWGQNLMEHPHLHCIMPAGGLSQ